MEHTDLVLNESNGAGRLYQEMTSPSDKSNNNLSVLVNRATLASNSCDVIGLTLLRGCGIARFVFKELFTGSFAEH